MTIDQIIVFCALPLAGYLLGSIPFAWVIGKMRGVDIRTVGSKNIGATNLGRTLGKKYFWQAFLLDAAKGFFPVLAATLYVQHCNDPGPRVELELLPLGADRGNVAMPPPSVLPYWAPLLTGIACVTGHLLPVWLKFKGGKGVATGFGVVLGFWPVYTIAGALAGMFFVFMLLVYRYISLASMTAAVAFAAFVTILTTWHEPWLTLTYMSDWGDRLPLIIVAAMFAALIVLRHRGNIARLLKGAEPRIGQRDIDKGKLP